MGTAAAAGGGPMLFTWPEGGANRGVESCRPGHYVGTYSCEVRNAQWGGDAGTTIPIDGPVDLVLNRGQSGEFLTVSGGTLKSAAALLFQLSASVRGQLKCNTGVFSGQIADGEVSVAPFPPGGTFDGTMDGSLDSKGQSMSGRWHLIGTGTLEDWWCEGPWSATYQGP